ncbi:MFS transporter [Azorhizobium oxalatiphilum]|uniref:MFS transporter n=1 Tax=Azorhizobium oxalatiphilum TaxID=980631 RepID=A0A917C6Z2_9HYPH|nr:sugar porter family MFS transporter [Azorhizobium oxalatiphilum]GGF75220.1 MFS transporter [Azorhizobium oxalatiphilum]
MMIYVIAIVAAIAGFLFGFDEGVIAGALHLLHAQFGIDPVMEGVMTSAVPFGALFGALLAGRWVDALGRRKVLLAAALLFAAGAVLAASANGIAMLSLARLVLGFAIGMASLVAPLYISESAPPEKRGMLVSVYQLAITLGILGAYLINLAFAGSWRSMFLFGAVPGVALFAGMYMLRDTPRWLVTQNRTREARTAIASIRGLPLGSVRVDAELQDIARTAESDKGRGSWAELFGPVARPALVVGIGLFLLQQLSGINAVIYYAPVVFREAGFDSASVQLMATIGIGVVNVVMTVVGMALIDRIGRRPLLLLGFAGAALSLGMIAIAAATESTALDTLAIIGLVLYISAFAVSLGPLPWVMMAEVFPLNVRGLGMGTASLANWGFNFLVVFSFPLMVAHLGLGGVFAIYALVCAAGVIFALRVVPETNGVPLEDIERHLRSGQPLRTLKRAPAAGEGILLGGSRP